MTEKYNGKLHNTYVQRNLSKQTTLAILIWQNDQLQRKKERTGINIVKQSAGKITNIVEDLIGTLELFQFPIKTRPYKIP